MKYWVMNTEQKSAAFNAAQTLEDWDATFFARAGSEAEVGDGVLLWRGGRGGGVVAIGEIAGIAALTSSELNLRRLNMRRKGGINVSEADPVSVVLEFGHLMLSTPLSAGALEAADLGHVVKRARATGTEDLKDLSVTGKQWRELIRLSEKVQVPTVWPATWNVPPGSVVTRAELHEVYGGNPRLTVSSSAKTPNAFLFLSSDQEGARAPRWDRTLLMAPGHGQDWQTPTMENLAALAHRRRGVPLRVFVSRNSECLYVGEFAIEPKQPVADWVVVGRRASRRGRGPERVLKAPVFRLRRVDGVPIVVNSEDAFRQAPRIGLSLHPSSGQRADAAVRGLWAVLEHEPDVAASLGELDEAQLLASVVQRARRQADLNALRAAVEDSKSSEADLQNLIQRMTWIFGGEFIPGTARRNLTPRDQLDLALIRPDGTLHGVELKRANIKKLVTGHRSHLIPGPEVHEAVCQATNYLRELDEKRAQILIDLGIDCRRASMTVVIGHTYFVAGGITAKEVDETIRSYNSDRTRVSVTTYDRLIENAQRALDLTAPVR
ncbi:Shedu anti-phage system protein SduA domain-containing protein [Streptomyces canus]|uniref:Shedu anti-phage system protein SduA domain-containing protein n=1 Tax=Streptomyces canus TaxID=58343 RepID=UPI002DDA0E80|nr:Shedu anti-phage system protein SduA domain-containing protein [Streptomyces canus]WSD87561.1 DUF4263 domain-containing protein [Streptomyces canus]